MTRSISGVSVSWKEGDKSFIKGNGVYCVSSICRYQFWARLNNIYIIGEYGNYDVEFFLQGQKNKSPLNGVPWSFERKGNYQRERQLETPVLNES